MKSVTRLQSKLIIDLAQKLEPWYLQNLRPLPWRINSDPYRIWISEIMLQQTTVQAVIPYFERFIERYENVDALAKAKMEDLYSMWSGLGYYTRIRNIHKSAQLFSQNGFPQDHVSLLEYPGFGPYTSRAVASIAFNQPVGVLDGNVIRVLSRVFGLKLRWWETKARQELQQISDQIVMHGTPRLLNQGFMELGASICSPHSPACTLCPWMKECDSFAKNKVHLLPLRKPRKAFEIWQWKPLLIKKGEQIATVKNDYAPFLKGQFIFPGTVQQLKTKPKHFVVHHTITHHKIYVSKPKPGQSKSKSYRYFHPSQMSKVNPSILLSKVLDQVGK